MSDNPIRAVLGILRLLKKRQDAGSISVAAHVQGWGVEGQTLSEAQIARIFSYVLETASDAEVIISNSSLSDEAKDGLIETTKALQSAFRIPHANNQLQGSLSSLGAAISNFSILTSATGLTAAPETDEVASLIESIEALRERFSDEIDDPVVRETAKRHINVLLTFLKNIDAFGVDAAMAAYAELTIRLHRAGSTTKSEQTKASLKNLWPEVERWAGRLAIIDQAYNSGQSLLGHAGELLSLLPHIPGS